MRFWLILATAVIPFFNSYANAQITVYGVPADLAGDVSMSVVQKETLSRWMQKSRRNYETSLNIVRGAAAD